MDITSYERRIKLLKLRGELLAAEEDRLHGDVGFTIDEVVRMMQKASKELSIAVVRITNGLFDKKQGL